jgi:hypothetical protein
MVALVLNTAQERLLKEAPGHLPVQNEAGERIGVLILEQDDQSRPVELSGPEIEEIVRRMSDPNPVWYTTQEVLEHLKSLDKE